MRLGGARAEFTPTWAGCPALLALVDEVIHHNIVSQDINGSIVRWNRRSQG